MAQTNEEFNGCQNYPQQQHEGKFSFNLNSLIDILFLTVFYKNMNFSEISFCSSVKSEAKC